MQKVSQICDKWSNAQNNTSNKIKLTFKQIIIDYMGEGYLTTTTTSSTSATTSQSTSSRSTMSLTTTTQIVTTTKPLSTSTNVS